MSGSGSEEINPYAAPVTDATTGVFELPESDAIFSLNAKANTGVEYLVFGFPDRLQLRSKKDGQTYEVFRADPLFVKLIDGLVVRRSFRIKLKRMEVLKFDEAGYSTLKEWIGPPTFEDLREAVGGKGWWQLIVAGMFLIPMLLGPTLRLYEGVSGALLLTNWIGGRVRPHRWLFLTLVALFTVFAVEAANRIYSAAAIPPLQCVWLLICCVLAWTNWKQFGKYKGV